MAGKFLDQVASGKHSEKTSKRGERLSADLIIKY
jgi:hypothetical protein